MTVSKPAEYDALCQDVRPLTSEVSLLRVKLTNPGSLSFRPGQFVNIYIPRGDERPQFRSYSMASSLNANDELLFCFDSDVEGVGTRYLLSLTPGAAVKFKGPLGIFYLKEPTDRPLFMATHISALGVAIMIAKTALEESPRRVVTILHEVKDASGLYFTHDLLQLAQKFPQFRYVLSCPKAGDVWNGARRSLLDEILRRMNAPADTEVFVCGLGNMVNTLRDGLKAAGVPSTQLRVEKWSRVDSSSDD